MMRARTFLRWLLGALVLLAFLLVVTGGIVWMRLPSIAEHWGEKALREAGFEEAELEITSISFNSLEVGRVKLKQEGWAGTVEHVVVSFDPMAVWKERQIETVKIGSLQGTVEWNFVQEQLRAAPASEPEEGAEARDVLPVVDLSLIPFDRVTIESLTLTVRAPEWTETVTGELSAELPSREELKASLSLDSGQGDTLALEARWKQPEARAEVVASLSVKEPVRWLNEVYPDWAAQLPEVLAQEPLVRGIHLAVDGVVTTEGLFSGQVAIDLEKVAVSLAEEKGRGAVEGVRGALRIERNTPEIMDLDAGTAQWESGELVIPPQSIHLTILPERSDLAAWQVILADPLRWRVPTSEVEGALDFAFRMIPPSDSFPGWLGGTFEISALKWKELGVEATTLDFDAMPQCASLSLSPLSLVDRDPFRLEPLRLEARQEATDDHWAFWGGTGLSADAAAGFIEHWKHVPLALTFAGSANPQTSAVELDGEMRTVASDKAESRLFAAPTMGVSLAAGEWSLDFSVKSADGANWDTRITTSLSTDRARLDAGGTPLISIPALYFDSELSGTGITPDWIDSALADSSRWLERLKLDFSMGADAVRGPFFDASWPYFEGRTEGSRLLLSGYGGLIEVVMGSTQAAAEESTDEVEFEAEEVSEEAAEEASKERILPIGQFSLETTVAVAQERLQVDGLLGFGFAGAPGEVPFGGAIEAWQSEEPRLHGEFELRPLFLDYVDIFGRIFPALEGLSFTGTFAGAGDFSYDSAGPEVSGRVELTGAEVSLPSSQLELRGIEARVVLDSLRDFRTQPDGSYLEIDTVQAGDLAASDATVRFALSGLDTLSLEELRLNFFDGEVQLVPTRIDLDEQSLQSELRFERLSLHRIGEQISVFDGTMAGVISGSMPFAIEKGTFQPREGFLRLPDGEKAFLSLNAEGLLAPAEASEPSFTDKVLAWLGVVPEKLVEQALQEIEVNQLEVSLFPQDTPQTPIHIQLGGQARANDTVVPVHLETRINGTLTELYNFLIRMQALDAVSF